MKIFLIALAVIIVITLCAFLVGCSNQSEEDDSADNSDTVAVTTEQERMELLGFLKENITDTMTLPEIVDVFEKMCETPVDEDLILYETGTYDFTGKSMFYFSLVRQFPNGEDEFYQIHVDVLYEPNSANKKLSESEWNDCIDESIFDYVRKSKSFEYAKQDTYKQIDIFIDET